MAEGEGQTSSVTTGLVSQSISARGIILGRRQLVRFSPFSAAALPSCWSSLFACHCYITKATAKESLVWNISAESGARSPGEKRLYLCERPQPPQSPPLSETSLPLLRTSALSREECLPQARPDVCTLAKIQTHLAPDDHGCSSQGQGSGDRSTRGAEVAAACQARARAGI